MDTREFSNDVSGDQIGAVLAKVLVHTDVTPPPPLPPKPNNDKIYDGPRSLLALSPGRPLHLTHTDFQECPGAWELLLVGNSSSPLHEDTQSHRGLALNTGDPRPARASKAEDPTL